MSTLQVQDIIATLILRKLSKFCDEYNGMIIKVFRYISELHKSKGIPNILECP